MSEEMKDEMPVEAPVKKHDIKELKEVIVAVKALAVIAVKAMKDGKIDLGDSMLVMDLGQSMPLLAAAVENVKMVEDEVKDIDADEAVELVQELYMLAAAAQEARK